MSDSSIYKVRDMGYDARVGMVTFSGISNLGEAKRLLKFFMQSVLDCHVPFTKVVGFKFGQKQGAAIKQTNAATSKFVSYGYALESIPEVANKLSQMVIVGWDGKNNYDYSISTPMGNGEKKAIEVVSDSNSWDQIVASGGSEGIEKLGIEGKAKIRFMEDGVTLYHAVNSGVYLDLILQEDTGFHDMDYTASTKNSSYGEEVDNGAVPKDYFFMNVNYSLNDFVRIIPPRDVNDILEGNTLKIQVRFYRGMTFDIFNEMWVRMFTHKSSSGWISSQGGYTE